jgi:hypothetical protein
MNNTIYISGKMQGIPGFNYPAFFAMEEYMQKNWPYTTDKLLFIHNPARIDELNNLDPNNRIYSREWYLTKAVEMLLKCSTIVMLDGWEESAGARLEFDIAKELKMTILDQRLEPYKFDILEEASRLVNGPRQQSYGHPKDNFTDIGRIWGALLQIDDIPPAKVALMMAGLKLAREIYKPSLDSKVDCIGYILAKHMVEEYKPHK